MNANELADWFDGRILYLWDAEDGQYYDSAIADEIVPMLRQQQAEIEALKEVINDALKSVPAMGEGGEFYHEHHGMDGEYLGFENIPANYVVQEIEEILRKAQEK